MRAGGQCASCKRFQVLCGSGGYCPSVTHLEKALVCDTVGAALYSTATAVDKPAVLSAVSLAFGREPAISAAIPKVWNEETIASLRAKTFLAACQVRHTCFVGLSEEEIENFVDGRGAYSKFRDESALSLAPVVEHDGTLSFTSTEHPLIQMLVDIPPDFDDRAAIPIYVKPETKYSTLEPLCSLLDGNRKLVVTHRDGDAVKNLTCTLPKSVNIILLASDISNWQPALLSRVMIVQNSFKPVDYKAKFEASEAQVAELKAELEALKAKLSSS